MEFIDKLDGYWPIIILLLNAIAVWIAWSFRKTTVSPEAFGEFTASVHSAIEKLDLDVRNNLSDHEKRITTVEANLKHSPTHEDIEKIHVRLSGISRSTSKVEGATNAMANQSALIYQHLLDQNKGGK